MECKYDDNYDCKRKAERPDIKLVSGNIEQEGSFKYLGSVVSCEYTTSFNSEIISLRASTPLALTSCSLGHIRHSRNFF